MKTIVLARGQTVLVDAADYESLSRHKWCMNTYGYAVRAVPHPLGTRRQTIEFMHRTILGLTFGDEMKGDHINGNRLDNRRGNLRKCSQTENSRNCRRSTLNKSGYKGVHQVGNRWRAMIRHQGKKRPLGTFDTPQEAHEFYCLAADLIHQNFSNHG